MPKKLSESLIQSRIINNLERSGWLVVKIIQSNRNGIPDLMCLRRGQCVFVEVKATYNKSSPLQTYMQNKLRDSGVTVIETNNPDFLL